MANLQSMPCWEKRGSTFNGYPVSVCHSDPGSKIRTPFSRPDFEPAANRKLLFAVITPVQMPVAATGKVCR